MLEKVMCCRCECEREQRRDRQTGAQEAQGKGKHDKTQGRRGVVHDRDKEHSCRYHHLS